MVTASQRGTASEGPQARTVQPSARGSTDTLMAMNDIATLSHPGRDCKSAVVLRTNTAAVTHRSPGLPRRVAAATL